MTSLSKRISSLFFKQDTVAVESKGQYINQKIANAFGSNSSFDFTNPDASSTIYNCINIVSSNLSKLVPHVYRKTSKGKEIYHEHFWEKALSISPDGRLSTAKWLKYAKTKELIEGTAIFYIDEFSNRLVAKGCVKSVVAYEGEVYYKFDGDSLWYPSKKLVINYGYSRDGVTGLPITYSLKNELQIAHGAEQTTANFYKNNLFQVLYLEANIDGMGKADKNKADEYFKKIESEIAGSRNAFTGGLIPIPPLYTLKSLPTSDLKFLDSSKYTESRIAASFQIPAYMLNISEGNTTSYSKIEAQQLSFLNNCLSSHINALKSELTFKLLTLEEIQAGITIDFDLSELFNIDLESKSTYFKNLQSMGVVSVNEIRDSFGYEKLDSEYADLNWLQTQNAPLQLYPQWGNSKPTSQPTSTGSTQQ